MLTAFPDLDIALEGIAQRAQQIGDDRVASPRDDPPLEHDRAGGGHDPNLALLRVEIDGTILMAAAPVRRERVYPCGAVRYHPGSASRFIPSIVEGS